MNLKAVLLDADNTLYTTAGAVKIADQEVMEYLSQGSDLSMEEVTKKWQNIVLGVQTSSYPAMRERSYSYGQLIKKCKLNKDVDEAVKRFYDIFLDNLEPMPGIKQALENDLADYKLAVVSESGKAYSEAKLNRLGFRKHFEVVVGNDDVGGKMKPDVKYYLSATEAMGVEPSECVMIGDNYEKDLKLAKSEFNMKTILVGGKDARADACIQTFVGVGEVIKRIWN